MVTDNIYKELYMSGTTLSPVYVNSLDILNKIEIVARIITVFQGRKWMNKKIKQLINASHMASNETKDLTSLLNPEHQYINYHSTLIYESKRPCLSSLQTYSRHRRYSSDIYYMKYPSHLFHYYFNQDS